VFCGALHSAGNAAAGLRNLLQADRDAVTVGDGNVLVDVEDFRDFSNAGAIKHALTHSGNGWAFGCLADEEIVRVIGFV
jgi:hypothetical protein